MTRAQRIKEYGKEVVELDEQYWKELGYKINYSTGLLVKIK